MVWIIISGSPQRKFKRLKDEFGIKDFDADKMEEVRKAIEVLNTKSDNIITFDDIIAVKYKNKNIPIGYGIATKLRERYGGWFHQSAKIFFTIVFDNSNRDFLGKEKSLFKLEERSEKFSMYWIKNISKLYKVLKEQDK
jgi:hypothetical protein